jgi:hypothetical protein
MSVAGPRFDLDEIRWRVSIVDLVARAVKLRRAGRGFNGLCPFHKEKTPSFTVNGEKGFYHCFGCGAHGDVFDWVRETEGCSFREAAERLAAGASIPAGTGQIQQREVKREARHDMVGSATVGRFRRGARSSRPGCVRAGSIRKACPARLIGCVFIRAARWCPGGCTRIRPTPG